MTTQTTRTFIPIDTHADLDALFERSLHGPVIIFKHSPTCGTSAQAYDELEAYLLEAGALDVHLLDVLRSRVLSQALAARVQVRHESPQVLVLQGGAVLWHGSHWKVTADAVRAVSAGPGARVVSPTKLW